MFAAAVLRNAAASAASTSRSAGQQQSAGFSQAHKAYVKALYRRYLKNSLDWVIRRDVWRDRAIEIRAEFERHRNVRNPRELASLFQKAEKELESIAHPAPYRRKYSWKFRLSVPVKRTITSGLHILTLSLFSHQPQCLRTEPSGSATSLLRYSAKRTKRPTGTRCQRFYKHTSFANY